MRDISIFALFRIARRRALILLIIFVVSALFEFGYCKLIAKPVYGASASIIVTNGPVVTADDGQSTQKVLGSDIQASLLLADTVVDMLETPDIYKYLARKLGSGSDYKQLMSKTSVVRRGEDTMFIDISYRDGDPDKARQIVNLFASAACDYIAEFIPKSNPKIVASADTPQLVAPRTMRMTALVSLGATFAAFVAFVLIELLNNKLRGEEDFTARYNIPLLGSVPDFEEARKAQDNRKGRYY